MHGKDNHTMGLAVEPLDSIGCMHIDLVPPTSDSRTRAKVSDKYILIGEKSGLLYRKANTSDNDFWEPLNHSESQVGFI
jgi:hypothetical protein